MIKPKIGDVIEIKVDSYFAYALYTHQHKMFGALIRVFERKFPARPNHFEALVDSAVLFETFFPLREAVRRGCVAIVANVAVPQNLRDFPLFRDGVRNPTTGKVAIWWLWDGVREW